MVPWVWRLLRLWETLLVMGSMWAVLVGFAVLGAEAEEHSEER